jgi:hypothetical protein
MTGPDVLLAGKFAALLDSKLVTGKTITNLARERVATLCGLSGSRLGGLIHSSFLRF